MPPSPASAAGPSSVEVLGQGESQHAAAAATILAVRRRGRGALEQRPLRGVAASVVQAVEEAAAVGGEDAVSDGNRPLSGSRGPWIGAAVSLKFRRPRLTDCESVSGTALGNGAH